MTLPQTYLLADWYPSSPTFSSPICIRDEVQAQPCSLCPLWTDSSFPSQLHLQASQHTASQVNCLLLYIPCVLSLLCL